LGREKGLGYEDLKERVVIGDTGLLPTQGRPECKNRGQGESIPMSKNRERKGHKLNRKITIDSGRDTPKTLRKKN